MPFFVHRRLTWTLAALVLSACGGETSKSGPTTLVKVDQPVSYLAVDGHDLFWSGSDAVTGQYTVVTMPTTGGTPRTLATSKSSGPLAVDAANVYSVTNGTDGAVIEIPRDGSAAITLAKDLHPSALSIALNSSDVYWSGSTAPDPVNGDSWSGVFEMGLAGGEPQMVPGSELCEEWLFVDETNLYCPMQKVPLDGSPPTALAPILDGGVGAAMAVSGAASDTNNLYLLTWGCHVFKEPLDGGAVTQLATLPTPPGFEKGNGCSGGVAVDGDDVYVANSEGGTLMKVPLDGSGSVTTLASGMNSPFFVAVDSTNVYWTTADEIQALPK